MSEKQLGYVPDEYRQLFQFSFLYRAIALADGLIQILVNINLGSNSSRLGLIIWVGILLYTILLYIKWQDIYFLVVKHPAYLGLDILICIAFVSTHSVWANPFYYYSISPIIPSALMFRLKGAMYSFGLLSLGFLFTVFLHDGSFQEILKPVHFGLFLGAISAYFSVSLMLIYPGKLLDKIVRQREIIREKTEKEAIYEERARLSRELHDNLAQMLAAIKIKTNALSERFVGSDKDSIIDMGKLISLTLLDLRNAIFALRSENVEKSLSRMLTSYCKRISSMTECRINANISVNGLQLPREQNYEILCICQEALGNAIRHSKSDTVTLEAAKEDDSLIISVEDRGLGFDPAKIRVSVGLLSMRERAEKLNGVLEITSTPGSGTKLKLTVPLENSKESTQWEK